LQLFIDEHHKKTTSRDNLVQDHGEKVKKPGILDRFFEKINSDSA